MQRSFQLSHDGKNVIAHTFAGFTITRPGQAPREYRVPTIPGMRMIQWAPDNKRFLFWHPEGVAVANVEAMGDPEKPTFTVIYKIPKGRHPFAAGWCPHGNDVFVLEHLDPVDQGPGKPPVQGSAILRIPSTGGGGTEILNHPVRINFFMPPVQRFEDGSGPNSRPYVIAVGAKDGLWVIDRNGGAKAKVADVPPDGVNDIVWSPAQKDKFALVYRSGAKAADGSVVRGLYLVHLDRFQKDSKDKTVLEQLSPDLDIHTIYFSKHGRWISWANTGGLFLREPDADPKTVVKVDGQKLKSGNLEIKSYGWDDTDTRVALAVGNRIYVYYTESKSAVFLAKTGDDERSFSAEPTWRGDEVLFSTFTNIAAKKRRQPQAPPPAPGNK